MLSFEDELRWILISISGFCAFKNSILSTMLKEVSFSLVIITLAFFFKRTACNSFAISKELQAVLLKKKANVIMTREKDTSLSMVERIEFLKAQNPDMLISIHLNSSSKDSIQGV